MMEIIFGNIVAATSRRWLPTAAPTAASTTGTGGKR